MKIPPPFIRVLAAVVVVLCIVNSAEAVDATWTGLGAPSNAWGTTTNWSTSPVPTSTNTATFDNAGNGNTLINTGNLVLLGIVFNTSNAAAYTLGTAPGTGSITFNSSGTPSPNITINSGVTNNQTINANLLNGGNTNFVNNSTTANLSIAGNVALTAAVAASRTINVKGAGNTSISGAVSNGASNINFILSLAKSEAGALTLSNNNSYTGTTTVSGGTLLINGDQSLATGNVSVALGAKLGGTGIIGGATTVNDGGILSPGTSPGTLTFASSLTLAGGAGTAGATAIFEGGDLVQANTTLTLNNDWNLTLASGFQDGGTMTLFTFTTAGATLDLTPDFDYSGLGFTPTVTPTLSLVGNSIVLNGISAIPEPSTWAILILGMVMMWVFRRRLQRGAR
ncbi:MAG: autotransporter-associated beta strand repeat-containing protein [Chthoniobacterales bacterium]